MINLDTLQTAAIYAHENDLEADEFLNLADTAAFTQAYAHAFGFHPTSVLVGLRLGYLALMASQGVIVLDEEEEPIEVPDRPTEEEFDSLPKLDLDKALRGVESDPES